MRDFDPDRTLTLPAPDADGIDAAGAAEAEPAEPAPGDEPLREKLRATEALCAHYREALQARERAPGGADARLNELAEELDAARRHAQALEGERGALLSSLAALRAECAALRLRAAATPDAGDAQGAGRAPIGAREAEIDAERSARLAAERAARAAEIKCAEQSARIAELEGFGMSLSRALQAQTEAAQRAGATADEAVRAAADLRACLAALERDVREDGARASAAREAADGRVQKLSLELERTRGALEERELQIRRLERNLSRRYGATPAPMAAEGGAAALYPLSGAAPFELRDGARTRIGRATDNEICLEDSSVSRHHAVIVSTTSGTFIEDLKSVNGIGVNGKRVRNARLADGDILTIGTLRMRFAFAARSVAGA